MIKLIKKGKYLLIETRNDIKVLKLDRETFVWIFTKSIGEMLVTTHRPHKTDQKLAKGEYRLYDVKDDPDLVDQLHLELAIGEDDWQGYLLPTGFPKNKKPALASFRLTSLLQNKHNKTSPKARFDIMIL